MIANEAHLRAAFDVAQRLGLPEPQLVRANVASLWRAGDVALRVALKGTGAKLIRVSQVVAMRGISTSQPLSNTPYLANGLEVTAWKWIDEVPRRNGMPWHLVGSAVRRLHGVPIAEVSEAHVGLETIEQVEWSRIQSRLDMLTGQVDSELLSLLQSEAERNLAAVSEISMNSEHVLLHGDLNPGNVMVSASGPILIDWELVRTGAPHWDHVPLMVHFRRFGVDPSVYDEFAAGYQVRYDDTPLAEAMCRLRELSITLGQLRRAVFGSDKLDAREADLRVRYWTSPEDGKKLRWTAR